MAGPDEWGMVEKFKIEIKQAGIESRVLFPGMVMGEAKQGVAVSGRFVLFTFRCRRFFHGGAGSACQFNSRFTFTWMPFP